MKEKITLSKRTISLILCLIAMAAMAFMTVGCEEEAPFTGIPETVEKTPIGEGNTSFVFFVTGKDGAKTYFDVKTDKKTVGEALYELGIIDGDEGQFGLYVKEVNGVTADYDVDGSFWGFYVNGTMAMASADQTEIEAGAVYEYRYEK